MKRHASVAADLSSTLALKGDKRGTFLLNAYTGIPGIRFGLAE
jgi:hypothetical protein